MMASAAHPDRGRDHQRRYAIRANHAFIYVRGEVVHVVRRLQRAVAGGLRRRAPRQEHPRLRLRPRRRRPRRRRRLHLRRGDRAARLARGPPRPAAAAAAVPRGRRPLRQPDGGQQRRVDRVACRASSTNGADWFAVDGHREVQGLRHLLACPATSRDPASTKRRSASRCASCSTWPAACATGHELKFWTPGGSSTPLLTDEHLDVPLDFEARRRGRLDARHPGAADLRRDHLRGARGAALDRVLQARVVRQVHAVPRGHLLAGADPGPTRARRRAPRTTSTSLLDLCDNILGRSFCALGDGATSPITSARSSTSATSTSPHLTDGGCPFDPVASTLFASRGSDRHDDRPSERRPKPRRSTTGHADHRRRRGQRAQGHPGHPRRRAGRRPDPAVLRPPAARAGRRLPPVPGRRPRRRQRPRRCPSRRRRARSRSPRAWWSTPRSPRRSPTRRSRGSWSSC